MPETKTIKCSNVKEKEGQYGPSLQIGYKNGEEWENYFVNDNALFDYFKKGERVTIEYEMKGNWMVVTGVSAAAKQSSSGDNGNGSGSYVEEPGKQKSIQMQTVTKAWAGVVAGKDITPAIFVSDVLTIWEGIFGDPLTAMQAKAKETFADSDDDIPFG